MKDFFQYRESLTEGKTTLKGYDFIDPKKSMADKRNNIPSGGYKVNYSESDLRKVESQVMGWIKEYKRDGGLEEKDIKVFNKVLENIKQDYETWMEIEELYQDHIDYLMDPETGSRGAVSSSKKQYRKLERWMKTTSKVINLFSATNWK